MQSNYCINKECFASPGFHPSSANEASIKLVWIWSAVTLYGCLMAPSGICQHQPQLPTRCELPSVRHTIPWAGKAQEKEGHALAAGPRTEPCTRMTVAGLPLPVSLPPAVSGQWGLSPSQIRAGSVGRSAISPATLQHHPLCPTVLPKTWAPHPTSHSISTAP